VREMGAEPAKAVVAAVDLVLKPKTTLACTTRSYVTSLISPYHLLQVRPEARTCSVRPYCN